MTGEKVKVQRKLFRVICLAAFFIYTLSYLHDKLIKINLLPQAFFDITKGTYWLAWLLLLGLDKLVILAPEQRQPLSNNYWSKSVILFPVGLMSLGIGVIILSY